MRNLLAFLAFCVLSFAIVGGYLGWYSPRTGAGPDGKPSLSIDFNTKKIAEDIKAAEQAIEKKLAERAAAAESANQATGEKKKDDKTLKQ
ncbi:MAG: hypothetical protein EBV06_01935 [Planctomycetia bacterium]|nr:hypothetical protein [Planctomycetia bacterium]